jgi:hypothetical protein
MNFFLVMLVVAPITMIAPKNNHNYLHKEQILYLYIISLIEGFL